MSLRAPHAALAGIVQQSGETRTLLPPRHARERRTRERSPVSLIERTRAGLAAAAANGTKFGRPRKVDDADALKARSLREKGITATDIAKMLGVSRATVYPLPLRWCAALCVIRGVPPTPATIQRIDNNRAVGQFSGTQAVTSTQPPVAGASNSVMGTTFSHSHSRLVSSTTAATLARIDRAAYHRERRRRGLAAASRGVAPTPP